MCVCDDSRVARRRLSGRWVGRRRAEPPLRPATLQHGFALRLLAGLAETKEDRRPLRSPAQNLVLKPNCPTCRRTSWFPSSLSRRSASSRFPSSRPTSWIHSIPSVILLSARSGLPAFGGLVPSGTMLHYHRPAVSCQPASCYGQTPSRPPAAAGAGELQIGSQGV